MLLRDDYILQTWPLVYGAVLPRNLLPVGITTVFPDETSMFNIDNESVLPVLNCRFRRVVRYLDRRDRTSKLVHNLPKLPTDGRGPTV